MRLQPRRRRGFCWSDLLLPVRVLGGSWTSSSVGWASPRRARSFPWQRRGCPRGKRGCPGRAEPFSQASFGQDLGGLLSQAAFRAFSFIDARPGWINSLLAGKSLPPCRAGSAALFLWVSRKVESDAGDPGERRPSACGFPAFPGAAPATPNSEKGRVWRGRV